MIDANEDHLSGHYLAQGDDGALGIRVKGALVFMS